MVHEVHERLGYCVDGPLEGDIKVKFLCSNRSSVRHGALLSLDPGHFFLLQILTIYANIHRTRNKMRVAIQSGKGMKVKVVTLC